MKQLLKNLLNKYFPNVLREIEILRFPFLPFYDSYASDELSTFLDSKELGDKSLIKAIKKDIYLCSIDYGTTAAEYFLFGFRGKQDEYRAAFLSDKFREGLLAEREDKNLALADLNNKYNFYSKNKIYFKREVVQIPAGGGQL